MALSKLSGDEQGIILGHVWNPLEPRLAVYLSSANKELRLLLTPALRQQLRADHTEAAALCRKVGFPSCKELREAKVVHCFGKCLSAADMTTLGTLGLVLPALESLAIGEFSVGVGAAADDGMQRLAEGLVAGALPAVRFAFFNTVYMGDAGASAFAAALDQGALPRLERLNLINTAIGDAALVALAPALRRRPALELNFRCNPLGATAAAADGRAERAQDARAQPHQGIRRWLHRAGRCTAQRRAACARGAHAGWHPCQRRGEGGRCV